MKPHSSSLIPHPSPLNLGSAQLNHTSPVHDPQYRVNRVELPPFLSKIWAVRVLVVVVLEQFAEHQKVEWQSVFGVVVIVVIGVAVFVAAPVDDGTVYRPHHIMNGEQQEHPPFGCESNIKNRVAYHPTDAGRPLVSEFVQFVPSRVITKEFRGNLYRLRHQAVENAAGMPHQAYYILEKIGGMRVTLRIRVGVVHPVHDGVGAWCKVGGALRKIGSEVKKALPRLFHRKHLVRSVAVMEKSLKEQANEPMPKKKPNNYHN